MKLTASKVREELKLKTLLRYFKQILRQETVKNENF